MLRYPGPLLILGRVFGIHTRSEADADPGGKFPSIRARLIIISHSTEAKATCRERMLRVTTAGCIYEEGVRRDIKCEKNREERITRLCHMCSTIHKVPVS